MTHEYHEAYFALLISDIIDLVAIVQIFDKIYEEYNIQSPNTHP